MHQAFTFFQNIATEKKETKERRKEKKKEREKYKKIQSLLEPLTGEMVPLLPLPPFLHVRPTIPLSLGRPKLPRRSYGGRGFERIPQYLSAEFRMSYGVYLVSSRPIDSAEIP